MQLVASGLKWNAISKQMTGRNTKMCYARHKRLLAKRDSPLRVRYWTNAEDKLLMRLVETEGTNWKYLSTFFNGKALVI